MPGSVFPVNNLSQETIQLILAAAAAGSIALFALNATRRPSEDIPKGLKSLKDLPAPKGELPYVGHLLSLGNNPAVQMTKWQKEIGPLMRVQMGVQSWILISDPYVAHELFVTRGVETSDRPFQTFNIFHSFERTRGLALSNANKNWKRTRTAALSILSPKSVDRFTPIIEHEADYLTKQLLTISYNEGSVFPISVLQSASLNVILSTCLGMRATSTDDPLFQKVAFLMNKGMKLASVEKDMSVFLPVIRFVDTLVRKEAVMREFVYNERNPVFRELIKAAVEGDQDCFIKSLHEMKEEYEMDDDNILTTCVDIIFAGGDTVSVSLSWAFAILCHHPDVQQKLRDEVDGFIRKHKRLPGFSEREELPYLLAVTKEFMRYRPTTPFGLPHISSEDIEFQGYHIPKGTTMISNMWAMHHNPKIYDRPEEFIPERFLDNIKSMFASANGKIDHRDHYNFGWGRRICPGIYLAEVELFTFLVRIFSQCKIEPAVNEKGEAVLPDLNSARDGGIVILPETYKARFVKRTDCLLD